MAREHAGLTQEKLSKLAPVPLSTLAEAETKGKRAGYYSAQVALVCGVNPVWLASGEGEMLDTRAAATISSGDILAALKLLTAAMDRLDKITLTQVRPLFSLLVGEQRDISIDAGIIAQRIAELLASAPALEARGEESRPTTSGVDVVINQKKGQTNGAGDRAATDKRKTGRG